MRERIIVALDTPDADEAVRLASLLAGRAERVKVGMTLFYAAGPDIISRVREKGPQVFLDLKLHDIPHQVESAARAIASLGADMLTVHASGGASMLAAAVRGAAEGAANAKIARPSVLAVTVLTSMGASTLASVGVRETPADQVHRLARLALDAGADGVVCSPDEAWEMREMLGPDALVVTPGIRPPWAEHGDQVRVATPCAALDAGASHLVIGRPITAAPDPAAAFDRIVAEE